MWAIFDFLMPNFLGSSASFAREFAAPICKSHLPSATAAIITEGIEKLKLLHQQVLPFILRREKEDVLKELPSKIISVVNVPMSNLQARMYNSFCSSQMSSASLEKLQSALQMSQSSGEGVSAVGTDVLKSLLFLRLLCTHPSLVAQACQPGRKIKVEWQDLGSSGKLLALVDLLQSAGIHEDGITAADNDTSLLYCDDADDSRDTSYQKFVSSIEDSGLGPDTEIGSPNKGSKCIIFAQFTKSLDVVEDLVFKPHMPSLKYLRLDGQVPAKQRANVAGRFNNDIGVRVLLATTRVGGLGLNLTGKPTSRAVFLCRDHNIFSQQWLIFPGADTVIFLENDFNPFADLQAMDRYELSGIHHPPQLVLFSSNAVLLSSCAELIVLVRKKL